MLRYFFSNDPASPVDGEIDAVLEEMREVGVAAPEYPTLISHLNQLMEIKKRDRPTPMSRDTMAIVAGNLLGIIALVVFESRGHVMTSKGFSQIIRPREPR